MDIKGTDLIYSGPETEKEEVLKKVISEIKKRWSNVVVEEEKSCVHCYRNQKTKKEWEQKGWNEDVGKDFITIYPEFLVVVTELDQGEPLRDKIEELFGSFYIGY